MSEELVYEEHDCPEQSKTFTLARDPQNLVHILFGYVSRNTIRISSNLAAGNVLKEKPAFIQLGQSQDGHCPWCKADLSIPFKP